MGKRLRQWSGINIPLESSQISFYHQFSPFPLLAYYHSNNFPLSIVLSQMSYKWNNRVLRLLYFFYSRYIFIHPGCCRFGNLLILFYFCLGKFQRILKLLSLADKCIWISDVFCLFSQFLGCQNAHEMHTETFII